MSRTIYYLLAVLLLATGAGCGAKATTETPGRTLEHRESLDPRADAFLDQVDRAWLRSDYDAVFVGLDSAARYAPELADVPYWRGRTYVMLNRLDEATSAFEATLELDAYYPGAYYELGSIDFRERRFQSALEHYQQEEAVLVRLLEDDVPYPAAEPAALAATRLQMGRIRDRLGQVDEAYEAYLDALAADSTFAEAYYELSQLYETDGEFEKALEQARRAYAAAPDSPDNQYALGALLLRNEKPAEALPYLQASIEQRPWYHPALNNAGRAMLQMGHTQDAERYLKRAEEMQALDVEIEQARLDVQQAPDLSQRWIDFATLLVKAGRYDDAEGAFLKAIYLEPMNLAYHNDAANLRLVRGDTEGAIQRFEMILAFDSSYADGWMNLGVAYALSERYDEAQEAWERVLTYRPDHVEAKANLARLSEMR